jgi:uncharacterized SAM-binding protein YcdF (DUF218 family)
LSSPLSEREKFIAYLDSYPDMTADALLLFQGDGYARVPHAIRLFQQGAARFVILVGGAENRGYGSFPSIELYDLLLAGGVPANAIAFEPTAMHTRAEVDRGIEIGEERGVRSLLMVSSPYHMYRIFLSFVAAVRHRSQTMIAHPASIRGLPLYEKNPWGVRAELYDREFERIIKYQAQGDVATFSEGLAYLRGQGSLP